MNTALMKFHAATAIQKIEQTHSFEDLQWTWKVCVPLGSHKVKLILGYCWHCYYLLYDLHV